VAVAARVERLTPANAATLAASADVVVDAADSFAVTYILNDACQSSGRVLVSASVLGWSGYVGVFCGGGPSYRAVFPELPRRAGSCAESGVLGTAVGVMGTLQAHLVLAVLLDLTPSVRGRLLSLDLRTLHVGAVSFQNAPEPEEQPLPFIDATEVTTDDVVVDLRSLSEAPVSPFACALRVDVEAVEGARVRLPRERRAVLCCRSGLRAWRAGRALQAAGHERLALVALNE
jgi:sulfur-carrier protein adenylyltransferase/sulfurtransferase